MDAVLPAIESTDSPPSSSAVPDGCYKVQVLVSENEFTDATARTFNILANGRQIANAYSVLKYSPARTVNSISWVETITTRKLDLQFGACGIAPAVFNGIVVMPTSCPTAYA
jgi:hypothetical protein